MLPESPSPEELAQTEATLRQQMAEAKAAYETAKTQTARIDEIVLDLGLNHPDGTAALRNATRIQGRALEAYNEALRRFNAFVLHYRPPRDLP
jgi:hypothetical protein